MRKRKDFIKQSTSKANETLKQRQRSSKKTQKNHTSLLGWIARAPRRHQFIVNPFIKDFPAHIFIDKKEIKKHEIDLHTIVRVNLKKKQQNVFTAEINEVFSSLDDPKLELEIIAENHGFPTQFSEAAIKEAQANAARQDFKRKDLTDECIVTIDGETAKDFDDAIFVKKLSGGEFFLSVSIADVSFYIDRKSKLDQEAYDRGTSIYFPGFAVPMLPEILSNQVCSLVPNQKRYTITCEMILDSQGNLKESKIFPSVIQSKARLTYTQVAHVLLEGGEDIFPPGVYRMLQDAMELSEVLKSYRSRQGYLDLDLPEMEIEVNKFGDVLKIGPAIRNEAHRLIENFMIAANEAVSEAIESRGYPSVYRVHEQPDPLKLERFGAIIKNWGFKLPPKIDVHALQKFLDGIKGHPREKMLALSLLRSLKQAHYTASNAGHFGLGSESYCHFTSPIRRYPDLLIHRILRETQFLKRKSSPFSQELLEKMSERCSDLEYRAVLAERDMKDLKKARFMQDSVGKTFEAYIVSVKDFGFFVEIMPFGIEGLVPLRSLPFDSWALDPLEIELKGRRKGKSFRLGDKIQVRLTEVDRIRRQMSFQYLSHLKNSG